MDKATAQALLTDFMEDNLGLDHSRAVQFRKIMESYMEVHMREQGVVTVALEVATNAAKKAIADSPEIVELQQGQRKISQRLGSMDNRFDKMDNRFDGMDNRFDRMDKRLDGLEGRITGVEGRLSGVEGRLSGVEDRLTGVEGEMKEARTGIETLITHLIPEKRD
jgi:archaellum component FlaC